MQDNLRKKMWVEVTALYLWIGHWAVIDTYDQVSSANISARQNSTLKSDQIFIPNRNGLHDLLA